MNARPGPIDDMPARGPSGLLLVMLGAACLLAACSTERADRVGASDPHGQYDFIGLDGAPLPVEYPTGSRTRLVSGTLRLEPSGRFALLFSSRTPNEPASPASGPSGTFTATRDSLFFMPDGADGGPPVRFRFETTPRGIDLWDAQGVRWEYARK